MLLPLEMMWKRVELARGDSDTTFFLHLLYTGEMMLKLTAAALHAAVGDDKHGHHYAIAHKLVRSDGLGEWVQSIEEMLTGPTSQHLIPGISDDRRHLTEKVSKGQWQHKSVEAISEVLKAIGYGQDELSEKVSLKQWFALFVALRNKTRAHGATTPALCAKVSPVLEHSIKLIIDNFSLFQRPWAYLHRNLSGKYRVLSLGNGVEPFEGMKRGSALRDSINLPDGLYIYLEQPLRIELISANVDISDFFFPNGGFKGKTFELLSLISDNRTIGDATPYLMPAGERPPSETEGRSTLDAIGQTWTNLPILAADYIPRPSLEARLTELLKDDRHPIVTLVGSGGIGKTSVALKVLRDLAFASSFEAIIWFSARDIDLLPQGPKVVAPQVLTQSDIAEVYVRLIEPAEAKVKGFKKIEYLSSSLTKSPLEGAILFVFDNFETVNNLSDIFSWIDTYIRLPNKVLITTRQRDFKADYPLDVSGMTEEETFKLIDLVATRLGIEKLLTSTYRAEIYEESDGHPYIVKVLLGDVARAGNLVKIERIVASREEVLDALFERTYANLKLASKRVFLTLCSWRSLVPQLALEAVMLRPANEKMDVSLAIEELVQSSFVQRVRAADGAAFLDVTLMASIFGRKKLEVSPMTAAINADVEFLQQIGAMSISGLRHGVGPAMERLFQNIANRVSNGKYEISTVAPSLEFICRRYPQGWLMLAKLYEEQGAESDAGRAEYAILRYLEVEPSNRNAWDRLGRLYAESKNWVGAAQAYVRGCRLPETPYSWLSNTANWCNNLLREDKFAIDSEEKRFVFRELAQLMEARIGEASATDLSRLAWLYLHLKNSERAYEVAEMGVDIEPGNEYCLRLMQKLRGEVWRP